MGALTKHPYTFAFDHWLHETCSLCNEGRPLWHDVVREVAFWRRRQHISALPATG